MSSVPSIGSSSVLVEAGFFDEPLTLEWSDLTCSISGASSEQKLLDSVFGYASPGRMLAIMGPPGSGKTTLLNSLAGRLVKTEGMKLEGTLHLNSIPVKHGILPIQKGYVHREDLFHSRLTVRETLRFAARLRMPREMKTTEKLNLVEDLLDKFRLRRAADTIVGDEKVLGINKGEMKRLSIACELIAEPPVIFVDEPTCGLDAFQADRVIDSLKMLSNEGKTVIVVISQPTGLMFSQFDDLLLLSEGRVMYSGPICDASKYMNRVGHQCPPHMSQPEFFLKLVSLNYESADAEAESRRLLNLFAHHARTVLLLRKTDPSTSSSPDDGVGETSLGWLLGSTPSPSPRRQLSMSLQASPAKSLPPSDVFGRQISFTPEHYTPSCQPQASGFEQFRLLFGRSWTEVHCDWHVGGRKLAEHFGLALIYGSIYNVTDRQASIQDRIGLFSLLAIVNFVSPLVSSMVSFPKEKRIVSRERSKSIYNLLPYLAAKVVAEAPISATSSLLFSSTLYPLVGLRKNWSKFRAFATIGVLHSFASSSLGLLISTLASNSDTAVAIVTPVIVMSNLFSGIFITESSLPKILWLFPKLSLIKWAWEGLCWNELDGLNFRCDIPIKTLCVRTGKKALMRFLNSFQKASVQRAMVWQVGLSFTFYGLTYLRLWHSGVRYACWEAPIQQVRSTKPKSAVVPELAQDSIAPKRSFLLRGLSFGSSRTLSRTTSQTL